MPFTIQHIQYAFISLMLSPQQFMIGVNSLRVEYLVLSIYKNINLDYREYSQLNNVNDAIKLCYKTGSIKIMECSGY